MIDDRIANSLKERAAKGDHSVLRSAELKSLFEQIKTIAPEDRSQYGQAVNALRQELNDLLNQQKNETDDRPAIDVTAPFDPNLKPDQKPQFLPSQQGTIHPLTQETNTILDIFYRMGFTAVESREIDDDFHMFGSLNFPEGHPARDDYDTFVTEQKDSKGNPLIAPAHTSTMQNRVLKAHKKDLESGQPIAAVIPGRVFRNEDLDARHEHTFYQLEGIYVDKGVNTGHLIATLQAFLEEYYGKSLEVKTNPYYFPFTEPSFEFMMSCPFCDKKGCKVCSQAGWIEILGCGMIHPNVLHAAGIDTNVYTGFAWGGGIDRLVMMKNGIEDVRYFESGRLDFLEQFA